MRNGQSLLKLFGIGLTMGAADIIPGVSGGTMALLCGIYEELIVSIRLCGSRELWMLILRGRMVAAYHMIPWRFLLPVALGIVSSVLLLSHSIAYLLETQALYVWSFFIGLIAASVLYISRRISKPTTGVFLGGVTGIAIGLLVAVAVPVSTPEVWWFLVLSGSIAICAMILPGISGAFILVLLGKYEFILQAVNTGDIGTVALVGCGAVCGLLLFSHVLGTLFQHYHDITIALLIGLIVGSLRKIWPWTMGNVLQPDGQFIVSLLLALIGVFVVWGIETYGKKAH